jgi:hypothetical protein
MKKNLLILLTASGIASFAMAMDADNNQLVVRPNGSNPFDIPGNDGTITLLREQTPPPQSSEKVVAALATTANAVAQHPAVQGAGNMLLNAGVSILTSAAQNYVENADVSDASLMQYLANIEDLRADGNKFDNGALDGLINLQTRMSRAAMKRIIESRTAKVFNLRTQEYSDILTPAQILFAQLTIQRRTPGATQMVSNNNNDQLTDGSIQ